MEYIIIRYGKNPDGLTWRKVIGRYQDKEQARAAGKEEADRWE